MPGASEMSTFRGCFLEVSKQIQVDFNDTYYRYYSHKNMVQPAKYWEFAIKVWMFTKWFGSSQRHCTVSFVYKEVQYYL